MINNSKIKHNTKTFHSIKNNCEFEYELDAKQRVMLICEFDKNIDSYEPFEFKLVGIKDMKQIDSVPGFIMNNSEGCRDFIIVSDRLFNDKNLTEQVSNLLQSREEKPITLMVGGVDNLDDEKMSENNAFLYEFVLQPYNLKVFKQIKETLDFIVETTIGELRRCIKNDAAIYQLMFHQAIRADLENNKINNDTIVYASPLINSIIRELTTFKSSI